MTKYDVQVSVKTRYLAQQSDPARNHYVFAYEVAITNHSDLPVQLLSRRWLITDGDFKQQEVVGEGVVGKQPHIAPGKTYEYGSGCVLETEIGTMEGYYIMQASDGTEFKANIAAFVLSTPRVVH